jgi:hypothetical protein
MLSDEVRSSGEDTLLNIQIADEWRKITVTAEALALHLQLSPQQAEVLTPERRCQLVRDNMAFVFAGVRRQLRQRPDAQRITLKGGDM